MGWRYFVNYIWTTFFKRPYTEDYIDIREGQVVEVHSEG